jgi:hypothetical protein
MRETNFTPFLSQILLSTVVFFVTCVFVHAAQYTMLEPSLVGQDAGSTIDAVSYLSAIYKYGIGVAGGLAVIIFAIGGIYYMFPGQETKGKEFMKRAVQGVLIALGAYLLLNTINFHLLDMNVSLPTAGVSVQPAPISTTPPVNNGSNGAPVNGNISRPTDANNMYSADKMRDEASLRKWASLIGIVVVGTKVNSPCTYPGETGCTDLYGIRSSVQKEMFYIAQKVGGKIYVTGGTEVGVHASGQYSHAEGYKVDIANTASVNAYVTKNFTSYTDPNRPKTPAYKNPQTGAIWYKEDTHWDVLAI